MSSPLIDKRKSGSNLLQLKSTPFQPQKKINENDKTIILINATEKDKCVKSKILDGIPIFNKV
jgi:hypothetical protein